MKEYRFNEFYGQHEVRDGDEWSFFCWPEDAEKLLKEGVDPDALTAVSVRIKGKKWKKRRL